MVSAAFYSSGEAVWASRGGVAGPFFYRFVTTRFLPGDSHTASTGAVFPANRWGSRMGQPAKFLELGRFPRWIPTPVVESSEFSGVFYAHSDFAPPLGEEIV